MRVRAVSGCTRCRPLAALHVGSASFYLYAQLRFVAAPTPVCQHLPARAPAPLADLSLVVTCICLFASRRSTFSHLSPWFRLASACTPSRALSQMSLAFRLASARTSRCALLQLSLCFRPASLVRAALWTHTVSTYGDSFNQCSKAFVLPGGLWTLTSVGCSTGVCQVPLPSGWIAFTDSLASRAHCPSASVST